MLRRNSPLASRLSTPIRYPARLQSSRFLGARVEIAEMTIGHGSLDRQILENLVRATECADAVCPSSG